MFAHETTKSQKLIFETGKIRPFDFVGTDDSQGHRQASIGGSSSGQAVSEWWRGLNHYNSRS
jgi:hypothetical protein